MGKLSEPSDEELLEGYAQGDPEAFELFFFRHRGRVYQYALRKLLRPELAAEVSQEVFLKLHSRIHLYRTNAPALPWFFTIVHNTCIDSLRRTKGKLEISIDGDEILQREEVDGVSETFAPDLGSDEHQAIEANEALQRAVAKLSHEQRALIEARLVGEKSFSTLATESGKSEVALRKIYSRALAKLRTLLGSSRKQEGDE